MESIDTARARAHNAEKTRQELEELTVAARRRLVALEAHLRAATVEAETEQKALHALLYTANAVGKIPDRLAHLVLDEGDVITAKAHKAARAIDIEPIISNTRGHTGHLFNLVDEATRLAASIPRDVIRAAAGRKRA